MKFNAFVVAAGAASLLAGAAYAQTDTDSGQLPHTVMGTNEPNQGYASQLPNEPAETRVVVGTAVDTTTTTAHSATTVGVPASSTLGATMTTRVVTNGPVPDTAENRARYGQPLSRAGKATTPAGN